jgi:hypothetical protein
MNRVIAEHKHPITQLGAGRPQADHRSQLGVWAAVVTTGLNTRTVHTANIAFKFLWQAAGLNADWKTSSMV